MAGKKTSARGSDGWAVISLEQPSSSILTQREVDGTKQDAFRVTPRNRDMRLFALESPGTTQDGKEAQHCLVLTEEHGMRGQLVDTADYRPFFCARCGAFSSYK